ncbi:hypothetical protein CAEBREN_15202 [Caenorhabditis brenneri]|uniref:Uncharacterized protein n=1 Tax=Caenorhabditis brenneri TaxID=135651 RepID=G0NIC1_CAEBE|nr:hypothetical protein CAEBREN_15202 [Caenorhabditis brenneri]
MNLPHPSLIGVPPETLDKIFKMLDYKEIQETENSMRNLEKISINIFRLRLRPVCRHLKNFVDIYRPDFRHKSVFVDVIPNGYIVKFATELKEEVKIEMKMKKTRKTKKMKKMTSVGGDEQMWRPLETLLAHQKSQLEAFRLRCESKKNVELFVRMLERIQVSHRKCAKTLKVRQAARNARSFFMLHRRIHVEHPGLSKSPPPNRTVRDICSERRPSNDGPALSGPRFPRIHLLEG